MKTNDKKTEKNIIRLNLSECDMDFLNALSMAPFIRETPRMMQTLAEELKSRLGEAGVEKVINNVIPFVSDELKIQFIGQGADVTIAQYCTDSQVLRGLLESCKDNIAVVINVAYNENIDEDTIKILVNEFYYITNIYSGLLARHHDLSIDVMKNMACHPSEMVKTWLAQYPEAPAEILSMILEHSNYSRNSKFFVAKHSNVTVDILRNILQREKEEEYPDEEILEAISMHKDLMTDDILFDLLNFWKGKRIIIQQILMKSNASRDVLEYVCNDMKEYFSLLEYDQTPVEILEQILQQEDEDCEKGYAEKLAFHPNANEQLLMELVCNFGWNYRVLLNVTENPNMTKKVFDFIIFEVIEKLPWKFGDNFTRNDVREIVCKRRSRLVRFE